jgi:C-terminal processing protease CtpA/Prc
MKVLYGRRKPSLITISCFVLASAVQLSAPCKVRYLSSASPSFISGTIKPSAPNRTAAQGNNRNAADLLAFGLRTSEVQAETNRAVDHGSGIQLNKLTRLQIEDLATLARVWGFLKYHHPVVTDGKRNWDYDLFRIMPSLLRARSRKESSAVLAKWIDSLGPIGICTKCASLDSTGLKLKPDLTWIGDGKYLGGALSRRLQNIYRNRAQGQQYYVRFVTQAGNPIFLNESDYSSVMLPDSGFQLLGLFRLWNIVEYWYPYRDVMGEDWPGVLTEFIPRVALASDRVAYGRAMLAAIAKIHDSHSNYAVSPGIRPPVGVCRLPVDLRFVDGRAIVLGYTNQTAGKISGLEHGDEITALDGVPVNELISEWAPLYAASNDTVRLRTITRLLTNGDCGPTRVSLRRDNASFSIDATRLQPTEAGSPSWTHDLPGPAFRMLSRDVSYMKLSSLREAEVAFCILAASETRGLIVDIRDYPSEPVLRALGSSLVRKPTGFAVFSRGDLSNPGAFHISAPDVLTPSELHYAGKVVILVDEETMSQAEYAAMALRSSPNAIVLGSTTAGTDGIISQILLPGGLSTWITGIGVFYPDGAPTQRIGIHLDVEVHPTVGGIRAGRDEILESAIHQILPELPESDIEKLAPPLTTQPRDCCHTLR